MNEHNIELLKRFYTAFQQKDYLTMQSCYHASASFSDPVFTKLTSQEVKSMWQMFCVNGADLTIQFQDIQTNDSSGSAYWIANYTFSKTGRRVENRIQAKFCFEDGLIIDHRDAFNFYRWSRQALGLSGWLLGWTTALQSKIQEVALKNLKRFMEANPL